MIHCAIHHSFSSFTMSQTSPQSRAVQEVLENPALLGQILGYLNNGEARDLVSTLPVSRSFFHASAATLCRRIEVPQYEYSSTKARHEDYYPKVCGWCYDDGPKARYRRPKGVTAHRSVEPGLTRRHTARIWPYHRHFHPSTPTMRELYSHVHVVSIEEHDHCDELATTHPLPLVRTVVVGGGHKEVCNPSRPGLQCGFLPSQPFRLILDGLCNTMLCNDCTSLRILSPNVETLVLRMRYKLESTQCIKLNLPRDLNPSHLVFFFPPEVPENLLIAYSDSAYRGSSLSHLWVLGPGDLAFRGPAGYTEWNDRKLNMLSNTFYCMAKLCLAVGNDCKISIVGADHGALHMRGFEVYDPELEAFEPLHPRPWGPEDESQYTGCDSTDSDRANPDADERFNKDGFESNVRLMSTPYACYDQCGRILSAHRPFGPIPSTHVASARDLVRRRIAIMERILHRWIDFILDSRLPIAHWEHEKDNFADREAFEQHLMKLKDEKLERDREIWHQSHECGDHCRTYRPEIPESEHGDTTLEDQDRSEDESEAWAETRLRRYEYIAEEEEKDDNDDDEDDDEEKEDDTLGFEKLVICEDSSTLPDKGAVAKAREEIEYKRMKKHRNISFITTHQYHLVEGNNDEMDDPGRYL